MGSEVKQEKPKAQDVTKPHLRKFFECRDVGPTPPVNGSGFWKKPQHGIPIKEGK